MRPKAPALALALLSLLTIAAGCNQSAPNRSSGASTAPAASAPVATTATTSSATTSHATSSSRTRHPGTSPVTTSSTARPPIKPIGTPVPAPSLSPSQPLPAPSSTPAPATSPAPSQPQTPPTGPSFAFDIDVPYWTSGAVYVVCDQATNGQAAWTPNAIALQQDPIIATRWTGYLATIGSSTAVTSGMTINYKVTRGDWSTVEKGPQGDEVQNRTATAGSAPTTVYGHVYHWADDTIYPPVASIRDLGIWDPRALGGVRHQVWAHLPPGYDDPKNASNTYPVLYCLDGQRLYDPTKSPSGKVVGLDVAGDANANGGHGAFIQIAIDASTMRTQEYGPSFDPTVMGGGQLPQFADWLLNELKPEIDRTYRTRPDADSTGVFGCELAGLAAFRLAWDHSDKVHVVAALSPLMSWNGNETQGIVGGTTKLPPLTIALNVGTGESDLVAVQDVKAALMNIGFTAANPLYTEVKNGTADETAWAAQAPAVLAWLFP